MSPFGLYFLLFVLIAVGLGVAAFLLNVSPTLVVIGVLLVIGAGILVAGSRKRPPSPPVV